MADMMDTLKEMLGDDAEEKIKTAMEALQSAGTKNDSEEEQGEDLEYIMKLKDMAQEMAHPNDARSNLLLSLRPFMRSSRQKSIDTAVRLLSLSKFPGLFS